MTSDQFDIGEDLIDIMRVKNTHLALAFTLGSSYNRHGAIYPYDAINE